MNRRVLCVLIVALGALIVTTGGAPARAQSGASAEQPAIADLVLANRILASDEVGVLGVSGHVSYRSRSNPSHFLIARNMAAALVTAADVYESDLEGNAVAGSRPDGYAERFADAEVYRARPEVMAIVTAETPEFVAFSVSSVPVHGDNPPPVVDIRTFPGGEGGRVSTPAMGRALAQAIGRRNSVLLLGRGAVITGTTINGVVGAANTLRENMRTQLMATSLGGKVTYLDFKPRPAGAAPAAAPAGGRAGGRGNAAIDPTAGDRPWNYWKFLANAEFARERSAARAAAPASPPGAEVGRVPRSGPADPDKELIDDLVLASRILSTTDVGILGAYGHVSARSRKNPNHYYISTDKSPGSIVVADIIENDLDSHPAVPTEKGEFQEVFIHGEIYKTRPDVMAVLHAHTAELVSFGLSSVPLRQVLLGASFIGAGLPNYDLRAYTDGYPAPVGCAHCISTPSLGHALALVVGNRAGSLLLGHGIAVVDASLRGLVSRAYDLRMNAIIQQMAMSLGGKVTYLDGSRASSSTADPAAWEYWKRMVAR